MSIISGPEVVISISFCIHFIEAERASAFLGHGTSEKLLKILPPREGSRGCGHCCLFGSNCSRAQNLMAKQSVQSATDAYENKPRVCTSFCFSSCLELQGADLKKYAGVNILLSANKGTHLVDLRKTILRGNGKEVVCEEGVVQWRGKQKPRENIRGSWDVCQFHSYLPGDLVNGVGPPGTHFPHL